MYTLYRLEDDDLCFACGSKNPIGLKLSFTLKEGRALGIFTPTQEHQGYRGMMHGGLVATLLDEAMAHYLKMQGILGVTGRLSLRFRRPVPLEIPLTITAGWKKERADWILLWGQLEEEGKILVEAEGLFQKREIREVEGDGAGRSTEDGHGEHQSEESGEALSGR